MARFLVALLAFTVVATLSLAADPPAGKTPNESCAKPCNTCAKDCLTCMKFCRENNMEESAKECEICHHACLLCAHAVTAKNARAWECCELCEKICKDCAATCDKGTSPEMKKCAEACRNCAKECAEARK